ncbi:magnesium/cobalt transporter CorA [Lysobacter capsici]|jgi:magnesium transporter|uniref:Magnesium transport protein CorA n=1 Tax=Lysobacter capsici AZ78 TaxID=1444315 RepID=A0A120AG35_9GAMM|nr:magnesium/cobalt transporter CorA [Lysobacter capsici]ALN84863.1 magnesium and cobalt transport protein CorA [Lysobacter capsici]ATE71150.1 magnesium and cobalt transport protein CorA [Lysobacter capsici]KWS03965.1 Magnesium and cobalt transport protein CorA [Lysobacter capsici AZ78]UOF16383.1 magnesium/cobalt transporter CorA [Lysobacter capsici]WND82127.1 magnesium/cobalt transporter CorA [Lysobacter capsici]
MKDPALPQCVINCAAYGRDGTRRDISLDAISDVLAVDDGSFVWVGLYEPDEGILEKLQEEFCLHDLAVEDAHNAHQRPKIESYGNSLFVAIHTAQKIDNRIRFGETHMFVGPRYLVTVRHGASISYKAARARMEREPDLLEHGPGAALYAVFDSVVDNFMPIVEGFTQELNELEKDIFAEDFSKETVQELYDLKRELTRLRMAVAPLQDILGQLARSRGGLIDEEIQLYFRDVLDHAVRINETTDTLREMLTAAVSVNLSLVTVRQGETVKRLGAWAALLAAPTLITSWYGMNFKYMPELEGQWSYGILVGVIALTCVVLYVGFKRAKWL